MRRTKMNPLSLRLKGFEGVFDGLRKEEIFIDFTKLPSGLIAIVGENGKGKSTIMDNAHPYRIMPSRSEKYSVRSFSYFDHIMSGKALKEFIWSHPDGRKFKSELIFTSKSKKSDCYLYVWSNDQWNVFQSDDGSIISDGKTDSYDRAVEHLIGSPELFFTCQYLSQNRKALSTYGNAEMKGLLSEMLGIEQYKQQSKIASEVAEILNKELDRRKNDIARMSQFRNQKQEIQGKLISADEKILVLKTNKVQLVEKLNSSVSTLQSLEQSARDGQQNLIRIQELNGRLSQLVGERSQLLSSRKVQDENDLRSIRQIETQIQSFKSQLSMKDEIESAVKQLPEINQKIESANLSIANVTQQWVIANEKQQRLASMEAEKRSLAEKGSSIKDRGNALEVTASLIDKVPCKNMDISGKCSLLTQAYQAKHDIVEVFRNLDETRNSYRNLQQQSAVVKLEIDGLGDVKKMLDLANHDLASLRSLQLSLTQLASRADQISKAESSLTEMLKMLDEKNAEIKERKAVFDEKEKSLFISIQELEKQLTGLRALDLSNQLTQVKSDIAQFKSQILHLEGQIEAEIRNQSRYTAEIAHLDTYLMNEEILNKCVKTLSQEISHWRQLTLGLGNNGIVALSIDDAGPSISDYVNKLLDCFGSQYSIEIQTQQTKADGTQREGFEILVHDSVSSKCKKLEFMSGGQKVWINDCLCRGMALYLRQNAKNNCTTLFSDETDGALSISHKRQFMKMKQLVMKLSGCEREYFISHTPDCIDLADGVIDLNDYAVA